MKHEIPPSFRVNRAGRSMKYASHPKSDRPKRKQDLMLDGLVQSAVIARRHLHRASKLPVEVGEVFEAAIVGDFEYGEIGFRQLAANLGYAQFAHHSHETLARRVLEEPAERGGA
jgi:hypothetical protein